MEKLSDAKRIMETVDAMCLGWYNIGNAMDGGVYMKKFGKGLIYFLKCIIVAVLVFSGSLMIAIAFEHIWPGVPSWLNPFVDGNAVENTVRASINDLLSGIVECTIAAVAAGFVVFQLRSGEKLERHETAVEEARFILEYNKSFVEDIEMGRVEHYLQWCYTGEDEKNINDLQESRQMLVDYLVYLEGMAACIQSGALSFERIDDLFAYRFFLAMNHLEVQAVETVLYAEYYRGCYKLYEQWLAYRAKAGKYKSLLDFGVPLMSTSVKYKGLECNGVGKPIRNQYQNYADPKVVISFGKIKKTGKIQIKCEKMVGMFLALEDLRTQMHNWMTEKSRSIKLVNSHWIKRYSEENTSEVQSPKKIVAYHRNKMKSLGELVWDDDGKIITIKLSRRTLRKRTGDITSGFVICELLNTFLGVKEFPNEELRSIIPAKISAEDCTKKEITVQRLGRRLTVYLGDAAPQYTQSTSSDTESLVKIIKRCIDEMRREDLTGHLYWEIKGPDLLKVKGDTKVAAV